MPKQYTAKQIINMSYTDFVGLVNQWNVPPGSYDTLTRWQVFGNITKDSSILEIACTTGFSSREIVRTTGAKALGVDISKASIEAARENKRQYAPNADLKYLAVDAMEYESKVKYSHVIIGAALRFFTNPEHTLKHFMGLIAPHGYLLSTEFYCIKPIPKELVDEARRVFNFTVTQQKYKDVMSIYHQLTLIYEDRKTIFQETEEELAYYCDSTIKRFVANNPGYSAQTLRVMYDRLMKIKGMSNKLRPYQNYSVLIHKVDPRYYPHRYTEIF